MKSNRAAQKKRGTGARTDSGGPPAKLASIQEKLNRSHTMEELCEDLSAKFARQSAAPGEIGNVRMHYDEIIRQFRCLGYTARAKPVSGAKRKKMEAAIVNAPDDAAANSALEAYIAELRQGSVVHPSLHRQLSEHVQDGRALKMFLAELSETVRRYVYDRWRNQQPRSRIYNIELGSALLLLLGEEWLRDPETLSNFLSAVFTRWRKIDDPQSRWRYRTVMAQIAPAFRGNRIKLQEYFESIGLLPLRKSDELKAAELQRIGKCVSRQFGRALLSTSRRLDAVSEAVT